jgi:hypothetical protein
VVPPRTILSDGTEAHLRKVAEIPVPTQNHVLTQESCSAANGRPAWWQGNVECHLMDDGLVVAIHAGSAPVTYTGTPTEKEIAYVNNNWYTLGATGYSYIPNEDCANFVSEALYAAGWKTDASWHPNSIDWVSSTHFRNYALSTYPNIKELKGVEAFSQVKVGDIAQFDWNNTGIRNHTAVVTKVQKLSDGTWQVWVGEHTDPYQYRNVKDMVTKVHPGATVYFLSL